MVKYSENLKKKVVHEYLEGKSSYKQLANKYGIKSLANIQEWVQNYKAFGLSGIKRHKKSRIYSFQFKLDVLDYMKQTKATLQETGIAFGITNISMISRWNKTLLTQGSEALSNLKGRPHLNKNEIIAKKIALNGIPTREEALEKEVALLRFEVAALKKLRAYQEDPKGFLERQKQVYHSNSRKKDSH